MSKLHQFLFLLAIITIGCNRQEDNFPPVPYLEYRSMQPTENGIGITVYFQDGDGDIDTITYLPCVSDGRAIFQDTAAKKVILASEDTVFASDDIIKIIYDYGIKKIDPVSQNGSMKGTITLSLDSANIQLVLWAFPQEKKYFKITLYDRAGNSSNSVITPYFN